MLYLAGIVITFFLAVILLSKKGNTTADHVLAAWLCIIGLHLFLFYLHITGEIYDHTYLLGIQIPLPLLHGPLLYIYTLTVTRENGFTKKYWLHFLPAAMAYAVLTKFFFLPAEKKLTVYKNEGAGFEIETAIILMSCLFSGFVYVLFSINELRKYRKRITDEFSNTEKINLNWLRYLIYGILAIWLIFFLNGGDPLIFGAVVVFVLLLGYFGITHMGIFTYRQVIVREIPKAETGEKRVATIDAETSLGGQEPVTVDNAILSSPVAVADEGIFLEKEQILVEQPPPRIKYEKSGLQKEMADKIHQDLKHLVETDKVFKQEELSLAQLAQQLGVHPNILSQVINTYENKNFYDYINSLRVREFKTLALLPENSRYTLLSLAFECGFNSKTAFNRNFKKITGQSPSEYLKEVNVKLLNE